jgi:hypothetical protein
MPCDGGYVSNSINYCGNVGWTLWIYSKRISAVMWEAKEARKILDICQSSGSLSMKDLVELERLVELLDHCSIRAESTWKALQTVVNEADPDMIEQVDEIAVIHSGESEPELFERISAIYGADTSDADSRELAQMVKHLATSVEEE